MDDKQQNFVIPESILSDLCSRFIITVPEEDRNDLIRIFFQIEIAHWFYLDFYCHDMDSPTSSSSGGSGSSHSSGSSSSSSSPSSSSSSSLSSEDGGDDSDNEEDFESNLVRQKFTSHMNNPHEQLKPCSIRVFAEQIFRYCPFLMQHSNQVNDILSKWKTFKHAVPTNGAIILDESMRYVLLVQGFWSKASWGFPKGKIFEEETESQCAIREVLEETGYDISDKLVEDDNLQININDQIIRLYIVTGVPKSTHFEPKTRREIKEVRWFALDDLPMHRRDNRSKYKLGFSPNAFFMVIPFIKSLKRWISSCSKSSKNGGNVSRRMNAASPSSSSRKHKVSHRRRANTNYQHEQQNHYQSHHTHHHHHHHQSHRHNNHFNGNGNYHSLNDSSLNSHHYNNNNMNNNSYKKLSKSNENLNTSINNNNNSSNISKNVLTPNKAKQQSQKSDRTPNAFLKHFSNGFSSALQQQQNTQNIEESFSDSNNIINNKQNSYYQKSQQNKYADLLSIKQAALANKTNNYSNNNGKQQNTVNNNNNKNLNGKVKNGQTPQQQQSGRTRTTSLNKDFSVNVTTNNNTSIKNSMSFNSNNYMSVKIQPQQNINTNNNINNNNNNNIRKQLNFNGPECWINFKFDMDSILQNLPPILDL